VSPTTVNQQVKRGVVDLLIPQEITLDHLKRLFGCFGVTHVNSNGWLEKCQQFLIVLYFKQITEIYDDGFVPLMSTILKSKFGDKKSRSPFYYKTIIDTLEECRLLQVNDYFDVSTAEKKGTSKSYKLILHHPEKMVKLEASNKWIELKRTNMSFHEQLKRLTLDELDYFTILSLVQNADVLRGYHFYHSWVNGEFYSFDDNNGRVHTPLHNLNRVFRSTIRFNQKPLKEVDISSCQPFLLLSVVEKSLNYRKKNKHNLRSWADSISDLGLYVQLIQSGDLYKYLLSKNKGLKKISTKISAKEMDNFKEKFFARVMFAHVIDRADKLVSTFISEFPTIYKAILFYQKQNPYLHLANHLQRKETEIIDGVLESLVLSENDIALRFHDAILVNDEIVDTISMSLRDKLHDFIGVNGMVKSKMWGDPLESILVNRRFNPIILGLERNRAVKQKRGSDIRKTIGKKGLTGDGARQLSIDMNRLFDNSEWRQELERKIKEIRLRIPEHYSSEESCNFKQHMKYKVLIAQDEFLNIYPELEFLRNSKTNQLYKQLGIT
jgi:hypothetical protein